MTFGDIFKRLDAFIGKYFDIEEAENSYYVEITVRREIFQYAIRVVYILTFLLIPIVIVKYPMQSFLT